jgi:hypothetical protein
MNNLLGTPTAVTAAVTAVGVPFAFALIFPVKINYRERNQISQGSLMNRLNFILFWAGGISTMIVVVLWLVLTVAAFRQQVQRGLLCWIFLPYSWYFALRHYQGSKTKVVLPYLFANVAVLGALIGIANQFLSGQFFGGTLHRPKEANFNVRAGVIANLSKSETDLWFQYIAGNFRWEIRNERGLYCTVRREQQNGKYVTTLNGFYSSNDLPKSYMQSRVLVSFGDTYGFGNLLDRVTAVKLNTGSNLIEPTIEDPHDGSPGYGSYVILKLPAANLEIYEQSSLISRNFTRSAFAEVNSELEQVPAHAGDIKKNGRLPSTELYPEFSSDDFASGLSTSTESFLKIADGMQPGIYLVTAWVPVSEKSEAFVKVFDQKTGADLSESEIKQKSLRMMGWSELPSNRFPYQAEVTVYEGDWDHTFAARFELWLRSHATGKEIKIIERTRMINGWER